MELIVPRNCARCGNVTLHRLGSMTHHGVPSRLVCTPFFWDSKLSSCLSFEIWSHYYMSSAFTQCSQISHAIIIALWEKDIFIYLIIGRKIKFFGKRIHICLIIDDSIFDQYLNSQKIIKHLFNLFNLFYLFKISSFKNLCVIVKLIRC